MSDRTPDPDRHHVHVEVHALSATSDRLHVRTVLGHLVDGATPDQMAAALAGLSEDDDDCVVHSTSWRYGDHGVVLTYVVLPDPMPQPGSTRPVEPLTATTWSPDPRSPGGVEPPADAVVAHACRHLAFLEDLDPNVAEVAARRPRLFALVRRHGAGPAGQFVPPAHRDRLTRGQR